MKNNACKMYSCILGAVLLNFSISVSYSQNSTADSVFMKRAEEIQDKIITFDTHNDSALKMNNQNSGSAMPRSQVSFGMMEEGGLDGAFFAIYVKQGNRGDDSTKIAERYANGQLGKFRQYVDGSPEASVVTSIREIIKNKKEGRISVVLALENGYPFGKDINEVEKFYRLGVRAVTLCHNSNNDICDSSLDTVAEHHGLSEFGCKVVKEMNRLGMIIDLSHASTETLFDVLNVSALPVIASHSGVYNIKNHPRNLKDHEIKAIAAKGGLIQVATGRFFLSEKPKEEVTVKDLADHIDYVKNLVGIEHVGLGTDFDGGGGVVGLENASKMKNLTVELLKRGYTYRELELFWGGNLLRLLKIHFK
jgi:microsomal dipeptidase-like Zn-dependent dipeptidase